MEGQTETAHGKFYRSMGFISHVHWEENPLNKKRNFESAGKTRISSLPVEPIGNSTGLPIDT